MFKLYRHQGRDCTTTTELSTYLKVTRWELEKIAKQVSGGSPERATLTGPEFTTFKSGNKHYQVTKTGKIAVFFAETIVKVLLHKGKDIPRKYSSRLSAPKLALVTPIVTDVLVTDPEQLPDLGFHTWMFETTRVWTFTYKNQKVVTSRHIERALGYAPSTLAKLVRGDWDEELIEGTHYDILDAPTLKLLRNAVGGGSGSLNFTARRLMVLYEPGVNMVLLKTTKAVGVRFRKFLAEVLWPTLMETGQFALTPSGSPSAPLAPVAAPPPALAPPDPTLHIKNDIILDAVAQGLGNPLWGIYARARLVDFDLDAELQINSGQEESTEVPRQMTIAGTQKLSFCRDRQYNAEQLARQLQKRTGEPMDALTVERIMQRLCVDKTPWTYVETHLGLGTVWDEDGLEVLLHETQATKVKEFGRTVEFSEDAEDPLDLLEKS